MTKHMADGREQVYKGIDPKTGKEIWEYTYRDKLGLKKGDGKIVHHKDGNDKNNSKGNLEVTTMAGHNKIDKKHHLGGRPKGAKGK